jgi:hypothetical protein
MEKETDQKDQSDLSTSQPCPQQVADAIVAAFSNVGLSACVLEPPNDTASRC